MSTYEEIQNEEGSISSNLDSYTTKQETTMADYAKVVNPYAIQWQNPSLMYTNTMSKGGVEFNSPDFKSLYDKADGPGKAALSNATSIEHAIAIAGRRNEFAEAAQLMEQDPFLVQLGMGLLPAMATPSTLLPLGSIGATVKLSKMAATVGKVGSGVAVGAATGAAVNMIDETGFEAQNVQYDYLSAGIIGMGFGGLLGGIGGALSGPYKNSHAHALSAEGDTYTKHFNEDPEVVLSVDAEGVPIITQLAPMKKSLMDRIPLVGKLLRSDVHTVYQDVSGVLRNHMTKWSNATVSQKDMNGNVVPNKRTAQNEKADVQGLHNTVRSQTKSVYTEAKKAGTYKGSYDDFIKEVSRAYTNAGAKQEVDVLHKLYPEQERMLAESKATQAKQIDEFNNEEIPTVIDKDTGKERVLSEDEFALIEKDNEALEAYNVEKAEIESWNQSLVDDIPIAVKEMKDSGKFSAQEVRDFEAELVLSTSKQVEAIPAPPVKLGPDVILKRHNARKMAENELKVKEEIQAKYDAEFKALRDEMYANNQVKFIGDGPIVKAAQHFQQYHSEVRLKGVEAKVDELINTPEHKLYRARVWNFEGIKDMDSLQVKETIKTSLASHPAQKGYTDEMLDTSAEAIMQLIKETGFNLDSLTTSFTVPKALPFESMLKYKKWHMDESKLGDLLKDNLEDVTGAYNYKMSGRIAAHKATGGEEWGDYINTVKEELIAEGNYSPEALQAFERVIEDTVGTLRMNAQSNKPQWTWTRNMMSANSARLGGGFGGNQFIELAANLMMNGMGALVNGRFKESWKGAGKMLYQGREADSAFTKSMVNMGFLDAALHTSRVNRQTDVDMGLNPGFWEKHIHGAQDTLMKVNGMRYFTAVMEDFTGGAIMTQIEQLAKKRSLTRTETQRIARWGLSHEDVKVLAGELNTHYSPSEGKFDLHLFNKDNQMKLQTAIQNGVSEMVIQGDSIHTPNWMKVPGPMLKLLTQFMRFPLIAQEQLFRRGMQEEQARFVGGLVASTATFMALKYTREQASIAAGFTNEIDAKYDYFGYDSEGATRRGVLGSLNYNANLGMLSSLWNYGAIATGNSELGRDYAFDKGVSALIGPTGSAIDDVIGLMTSGYNGEFGTDKDQMAIKGLAPFMSLPIISEGLNSMIRN